MLLRDPIFSRYFRPIKLHFIKPATCRQVALTDSAKIPVNKAVRRPYGARQVIVRFSLDSGAAPDFTVSREWTKSLSNGHFGDANHAERFDASR